MFLLLLIFISLIVSTTLSIPINTEIQRTIDASKAIVKITTEIKTENVNEGNEYDIIFTNSKAKNLAFLSVKINDKDQEILAPITDELYTKYTIIPTIKNPVLKVFTVFTSILEPLPKEIKQLDTQYVVLYESHYFLTPYRTINQKTTVKLSSSNIESFTKLEPFSSRGSVLTFGPYKEISAFEASDLKIHYANNKPFAKISTLSREVEVSHWGIIAMEEIFEVKHAGAMLKGGFSRFEHQMRRNTDTASFSRLYAKLPKSASNIYYRDQIGNISTSDLYFEADKTAFEISTRFPIFGGWQTNFYIGYSIPTQSALFFESDTNRYKLKIDFFTIFEDVWVEELEIKVILPEGCNNVQVKVPYLHEKSNGVRYTYLDSELNGGRPVITIKAKNAVEEHDKQIEIFYSFNKYRMLVEPAILVSCFFFFFVFCSMISRLESNVGGKKIFSNKEA